jgi:hypothetical protein
MFSVAAAPRITGGAEPHALAAVLFPDAKIGARAYVAKTKAADALVTGIERAISTERLC